MLERSTSAVAELFDLAIERCLPNPELLRSLAAIAANGTKDRLDVVAFDVRERTDISFLALVGAGRYSLDGVIARQRSIA